MKNCRRAFCIERLQYLYLRDFDLNLFADFKGIQCCTLTRLNVGARYCNMTAQNFLKLSLIFSNLKKLNLDINAPWGSFFYFNS